MTLTFQRFFQDVPATTLAQGTDTTQASMVITSATGWPSTFPFGITIGRNTVNEEHVLVGGRSGTTISSLTRDWENTGTTGKTHSAGEAVEVTLNAKFFTDLAGLLQVTTAGDIVYFDGTSYQRLAKSTKTAKAFLKSGTTPSYDWGSLPVYTSTANRTSDIASPAAGDASYLNTNDSAEGVEFYHGSAWAKPWNMPWGVIGTPASSTSDQTGLGTALTDVTFATATWTAIPNRLYRITFSAALLMVTSSADITVEIQTGASGAGTALSHVRMAATAATGYALPSYPTYQTGSGSISVHARVGCSAGTVTCQNATYKGWFVVEDAGPTGSAP